MFLLLFQNIFAHCAGFVSRYNRNMNERNIDINDPNVDPKKLFLEFKKWAADIERKGDSVLRSFQFVKDGNRYFNFQLLSVFAFDRNRGITIVLAVLMSSSGTGGGNFDSFLAQYNQVEALLKCWTMCKFVKVSKNKDIHRDYRWYMRCT